MKNFSPNASQSSWTTRATSSDSTSGMRAIGSALSTASQSFQAPSSDFSSDVGRKKFGFSHEELDETTAYYEGQFKFSMRNGDGTLHRPDSGAKYVGQFKGDVFHGVGSQTWPDGSSYDGQWKLGQKHGTGDYMNADGLMYSGQWDSGKRHGQGMQEYANGDKYNGWFFNGMCSGLGRYTFAEGGMYEGAWANGRYDGLGILYGADGSRERQWHAGGLLTKREALLPAEAPKLHMRQQAISSKVLSEQSREDMHKPTVLRKQQPSKYLIRRETADWDLAAPPLSLACTPAQVDQGRPREKDALAPHPAVAAS